MFPLLSALLSSTPAPYRPAALPLIVRTSFRIWSLNTWISGVTYIFFRFVLAIVVCVGLPTKIWRTHLLLVPPSQNMCPESLKDSGCGAVALCPCQGGIAGRIFLPQRALSAAMRSFRCNALFPPQCVLSAATDAIDSQLFTRCDPLEIRGGQFTQVTDCQMCPLQRKDAWVAGGCAMERKTAGEAGRGRSIISEGQVLPAPDPPTNLNLNLNYEKLRLFSLQNLCQVNRLASVKRCEV